MARASSCQQRLQSIQTPDLISRMEGLSAGEQAGGCPWLVQEPRLGTHKAVSTAMGPRREAPVIHACTSPQQLSIQNVSLSCGGGEALSRTEVEQPWWGRWGGGCAGLRRLGWNRWNRWSQAFMVSLNVCRYKGGCDRGAGQGGTAGAREGLAGGSAAGEPWAEALEGSEDCATKRRRLGKPVGRDSLAGPAGQFPCQGPKDEPPALPVTLSCQGHQQTHQVPGAPWEELLGPARHLGSPSLICTWKDASRGRDHSGWNPAPKRSTSLSSISMSSPQARCREGAEGQPPARPGQRYAQQQPPGPTQPAALLCTEGALPRGQGCLLPVLRDTWSLSHPSPLDTR